MDRLQEAALSVAWGRTSACWPRRVTSPSITGAGGQAPAAHMSRGGSAKSSSFSWFSKTQEFRGLSPTFGRSENKLSGDFFLYIGRKCPRSSHFLFCMFPGICSTKAHQRSYVSLCKSLDKDFLVSILWAIPDISWVTPGHLVIPSFEDSVCGR